MTNSSNETQKPVTTPVTPSVNPQSSPQQTQGDKKSETSPQQK
jgi:hypothetical protein